MKELLQHVSGLFAGKVNLLAVDDDIYVLNSMLRTFTSPAFHLRAVDSFARAIEVLSAIRWHCWVLDIDLGGGKTGLDIMKSGSPFPFVVIVSGLQSMNIAAEAVKQGAIHVFDKEPKSIEWFREETCKIAALGYLLDGKYTQYVPVYRLLCDSVITTPEEWAQKACLSLRQLQRICEAHPPNSPRHAFFLFYALFYLLWNGKPPYKSTLPPSVKPEFADFIRNSLEHVAEKGETA